MDECKYDNLLANIMDEERHLQPFLNAVFGFLSRRTDFFIIQKEGEKLGFPDGVAEKIVCSIMKKWRTSHVNAVCDHSINPPSHDENLSDIFQHVVNEEVVTSAEEEIVEVDDHAQVKVDVPNKQKTTKMSSSDTYNGADRGNYRWSQAIGELEIQAPVPAHVKKSKDANVVLTDKSIAIKVVDETDRTKWNVLVEGEFCFKIQSDESVWSLSPGDQIMVHCEKEKDRWWESLLVSEPKIDCSKIDSSRPMSDLSEEDQMKIEELWWTNEKKSRHFN